MCALVSDNVDNAILINLLESFAERLCDTNDIISYSDRLELCNLKY